MQSPRSDRKNYLIVRASLNSKPRGPSLISLVQAPLYLARHDSLLVNLFPFLFLVSTCQFLSPPIIIIRLAVSLDDNMRHIPRQSERDVRMHESPTIHTHPHSFASAHTPHTHINGSAVVPSTPGGMSNGSGHAMVSPAAVPISVPNGVVAAPSNMIHKLSVANEQTWLLIGTFPTCACFNFELGA